MCGWGYTKQNTPQKPTQQEALSKASGGQGSGVGHEYFDLVLRNLPVPSRNTLSTSLSI